MSELGGRQSGFSSPYNPNLRANNRAQAKPAIGRESPAQEPSTKTETKASISEPELVNELAQRRVDSQRIQQEVHKNRTAQADSYTSREEAGNARADRVAHHINSEGLQEQQRQHRERLARNINNASVGLQKALETDKPEAAQDQQLASNAAQSQENIDPDKRARDDLNKKLRLIAEKGTAVSKDSATVLSFISFVESRKDAEGLVDAEIMDLVNGYYDNVLQADAESLSPAAMVDGDHAQRFFADKIASDNLNEHEALKKNLTFSLFRSAASIDAATAPRKREGPLLEAPAFERTGPEKMSPQQRVINLGLTLVAEELPWAEDALAGALR